MIDGTAIARVRELLREPVLAELLRILNPEDEETRIVGGAVRNALIGVAVHDVDLGTTMLPEDASARAKAAGWHAVPTGIEHGTVTLVKDGRAFEVTTLREDIETDGRRAKVVFGRDFRHDAARRDFTINALSMGVDGALHDYFGGMADLVARRVRFIGDPDQRLKEDYLRGLRFLRFSAAYGGGHLDEAGFAAVKRHREGFAQLSRERVRQEFIRLLDASETTKVLRAANEAGLVEDVMGCKVHLADLEARIALEHQSGKTGASVLARLFALAIREESDVRHLREALRLTNAEEGWFVRLVEAWRVFRASGLEGLLALEPEFHEVLPEVIRAEAAFRRDDSLLGLVGRVESPPEFHLTGKDVLALGVPAGPQVGEVLRGARALWAERGFSSDPAAQRVLLEESLAGRSAGR